MVLEVADVTDEMQRFGAAGGSAVPGVDAFVADRGGSLGQGVEGADRAGIDSYV